MILNKSVINVFGYKKLAKSVSVASAGLLTLAALVTVNVANAQEYKKVTRLGTSQAVCPGGVETPAQLQAYFANNPDKIRAILADSGWMGSADSLFEAIANGNFEESVYPVGTKLAWMGFKEKGKYIASPYREWAGKQSFEAYQVNVSTNCKVYELAIPKVCCNVSLVTVSEDVTGDCAPVTAPAPVAAPVAPVAEVAPQGPDLSIVPFFGAFLGTETRPRFETAWQMDMRDSSGIAGLKAGFIKPLNMKTSLSSTLSLYTRNGINGGNEYPEENVAIDFGVERKLSQKAFIGGGIGAWNVDDSDYRDASVYGLVGGDFGKSKLQWFLEGRVFDSDSPNHDSLSDNKMVSAGIRYLIK